MDLVTGALGILISKLGELLKEEYNLQTGLPPKLESLIKELEYAQAALFKMAGSQPDQLDEKDRIWACEIREASYNMEDVLDTYLVNAQGDNENTGNDESRIKRLDETIDDINRILQEVTEQHHRYKRGSFVSKPSPTSTVDPRLEAMYKELTQLVGLENPSTKLISMLSPQGDDELRKKMKMVSVVGVGGLGKTTLVKAVYDKLKVDFECRAFVTIGREPDLKKVFRDILIELDKRKNMERKMTALDKWQLINKIREYLRSKRYFIVIEDIWETNLLEILKLALVIKSNNGSRLITTTRKLDVAKQADEFYELQPLPYEKSRKLFYTRIFGGGGRCPDNQLDEASDKIIKKCGGVPLAIITMASLLVGKSREEWDEVCTSIVFHDRDKQQVSDTEWILSLSYYDLPSHLKTCLLYLSAFPEDHIISKDSLIWKWLAEGFVHNKPGTRLFEVGEGYFNELINRSMIMAVESKICGIIDGCRVHDMVLDLLRVKSQEQNFVTILSTNAEGTSSQSRIHRLAQQNGMIELQSFFPATQMNRRYMRSFIACRSGATDTELSFLSFGLLRVVTLEDYIGRGSSIELKHLENIVHLRYFGLGNTRILEVPEGIGALKFLQTLDLDGALVTKTLMPPAKTDRLPSSVGLLTQLICLRASRMKVPYGGIGKLTSLEELQIGIPLQIHGNDEMTQFVKDLGKLRELRVLNASDVDIVDHDMQRGFLESIGNLHKLQYLKLKQFCRSMSALTDLWDTVLPRSLRCLIVSFDLRFWTLPSRINSSDLPNLTCLDLHVINLDEQSLKNLGGLPELRHLDLSTRSTATIIVDGCFLKLRSLVTRHTTVHFMLTEDSSISFTIWEYENSANKSFGSEKRDESIVAPQVMPNLEVLTFQVGVQALIRDNGSCDSLGLEYLPSLQKVEVIIYCLRASADQVENEEDALRRAMESHPKRPTLEISHLGDPESRRQEDDSGDSEEEEEDNSDSQDLPEDGCGDLEEDSSASQEDNSSDSENEKFSKAANSKASASEEVAFSSNNVFGEDNAGDAQTSADPTMAQRVKEEAGVRKRPAKLPSQMPMLQEPKRPRIVPQPRESETSEADNNEDLRDPESRQQI